MNITDQLSDTERVLIKRAVAHALPEDDAPEVIRFRDGVTDLDAARLIHRIERGAIIVPAGRTWVVLGAADRTPHLARIVEECLRLGLVHRCSVQLGKDVIRIQLAAAPVHRCRGGLDPNGTLCSMSRLWPAKRYRCTDDPKLIDCFTCKALDR